MSNESCVARVKAEPMELVVACDDLERPHDGGVLLLSAQDKWIFGPLPLDSIYGPQDTK